MNTCAFIARGLAAGLLLASLQATAQPADACVAAVEPLLKSNADARIQVFRSNAHAHAKAQALAELKRSDELLGRVCPMRTQQDADRRIEAAIARMNAEDIIRRGKPGGGAL